MRLSNNLENKIPSDTYCKITQLLCTKVQAYCSLEPPLKYNQSMKPLRPINVNFDRLNQPGRYRNTM